MAVGVAKCSRCSRPLGGRMSQLCRQCYDERAKFTYWDKGEACRAKGPTKAECLLPKFHSGAHEGNGYDAYGEVGRSWK